MFREHEVVRLLSDLPEQHLLEGEIGTVVVVYHQPGLPEAYEVDLSDYLNHTLKTVTLYGEDIERLEKAG